MKTFKQELEIEVLHSQEKTIIDKKENNKVVKYYELTILCPKLFDGVEKITSSENLKTGKIKREFQFTATEKAEIKMKLIKNEQIPVAPKN